MRVAYSISTTYRKLRAFRPGNGACVQVLSSHALLFYSCLLITLTLYFPAQLVVRGFNLPSATFWTSDVHRCLAFSPPVSAFVFTRVLHCHFSSFSACRFSSICPISRSLSRFPPLHSKCLPKKESPRARVCWCCCRCCCSNINSHNHVTSVVIVQAPQQQPLWTCGVEEYEYALGRIRTCIINDFRSDRIHRGVCIKTFFFFIKLPLPLPGYTTYRIYLID